MRGVAGPLLPVLELEDELVGVREFRRRDDLRLGRLRAAVADVVADRAVQQRGVLRHHRDLRAQALLRHGGDVLAVDQDAAALEVEEAQQQIDERRLAGTGAADEADLLAGLDGQAQAVDDTNISAVAEAHVLEADLALRHVQLGRVGPIGQGDRPRDRHHAFLDHADVLEDRGDLPGDPARDVDDLPGERKRHRHRADRDLALRPQEQREAAGARHQHRVERGQREAEQRVEPQRSVEQPGMDVDRVAHIGVFLARASEKLHRQDVGVAVDDASGEHRAPLGHLLGAVAHVRHQHAQHHQIADEPQHHRQGEPGVGRAEQDQRRSAIHQNVPDACEHRDQRLADRRSGLHHAVGDAACEIVLEERPRLAHHVPVVLPADAVRHVRRDRLVGDQILRRECQRPRDQQHEGHAQEVRPEFRKQLVRRARRDQGHDAAHEHGDGRIEQSHHEAGREQSREQPLRLAGEVPKERDEARRGLRPLGCVGRLQQPFEEPEHGTSSNGGRSPVRRLSASKAWHDPRHFIGSGRADRGLSCRDYDVSGRPRSRLGGIASRATRAATGAGPRQATSPLPRASLPARR